MQRINYDLDLLRSFVAVARRLSFRGAAEELFISQPALSRRIDRIEEAIGEKLLERTTRRVSLTPAGAAFFEHARSAIDTLEAGMRSLAEGRAQRSSLVTVACVPSLAQYWLPALLKQFSERAPHARIRMLDGSASWVVDRVAEGVADLGLSFTGAQQADIEFSPIHKEHYVLALRDDHRLAGKRSVAWSELAHESLVALSEQSGNRLLIEPALARLRHKPRSDFEANHVLGALGLVAAGLGVSVVPSMALPHAGHLNLVGVPLTAPRIHRTLGLLTRKGAQLSGAARELAVLLAQAPVARRASGVLPLASGREVAAQTSRPKTKRRPR